MFVAIFFAGTNFAAGTDSTLAGSALTTGSEAGVATGAGAISTTEASFWSLYSTLADYLRGFSFTKRGVLTALIYKTEYGRIGKFLKATKVNSSQDVLLQVWSDGINCESTGHKKIEQFRIDLLRRYLISQGIVKDRITIEHMGVDPDAANEDNSRRIDMNLVK